MASKVEQELVAATGIRRRKGVSVKRHIALILKAVSEMNEQKWNNLSDVAKYWVNEQIQIANTGKGLLRWPDTPEARRVRRSISTRGTPNRMYNWRRRRKSAGERLRELIIAEGFYTKPKVLMALLEDEGYVYSENTLKLISTDFRTSIRVLFRAGLLSDDAPDKLGISGDPEVLFHDAGEEDDNE